MNHSEYSWKTDDGIQIYAQNWEPEQPYKAVVCLFHGLGEHSGRYAHLAEFLTHNGYILAGFDLRGHGKSGGKRGDAPYFDTLLVDQKKFIALNREKYGSRPFFLYGHSLGGTLVLKYSIQFDDALAGVIATGPFFMTAFKPPAWKILVGKIMAKIAPSFAMSNEIDRQNLSRDQNVVQAYINDPLVHDRLTAQLGVGLLESGDWLLENVSNYPIPLLLMHGGADRLTSVLASVEFAERAGTNCTIRIWEGLYHEIHNEPEHDEVFDYLLQWLEARLTGS